MTNDQTPAIIYRSSASVAQLVEQLIRNQQVAGPSPATSSRCESLKSLERVGIWGFSPVCAAAADPLGASVGQARVSALEPAPFCPCCMPQRLHAGSNRVCARFDIKGTPLMRGPFLRVFSACPLAASGDRLYPLRICAWLRLRGALRDASAPIAPMHRAASKSPL